MIYLDNNATTRLGAAALAAMAECLRQGFANPASSHREGRRARRRLEQAREQVARSLGAVSGLQRRSDRVVFTSGATEANNLALRGLCRRRPGRLLLSALEHPSVWETARALQAEGTELVEVRTLPDGTIDLQHLRDLLVQGPTATLALMAANNETGILQPVPEAAALCSEHGAALHCDAVQAWGKTELDIHALGVSTLAVNAHKLHGPVGVGALVVRQGVELAPLMYGGFQQAGLRPGTESVLLAAGMAAAIGAYQENGPGLRAKMLAQRQQLESVLLPAGAIVHGLHSPRLPHTVNVSLPGCDRQAMLLALDTRGLACSTGSACASGSSEPSPVLTAMGLPDEQVESSLRLSLGADTTDAEIQQASEILLDVAAALR
jgi:cysteine desulfurase